MWNWKMNRQNFLYSKKEIKLDQNVLALKTESNWARKKRLYKIIEWKKMRGKLDLTWSQFRRLTGLPKQLFVKKSIFHKCKFGNTLTWTCTGCASIFPWLCRLYKYTKISFFLHEISFVKVYFHGKESTEKQTTPNLDE